MRITLDVDVLTTGKQYVLKKGKKKYVFQLVAVEDVEKKNEKRTFDEEFPGFGSVTKFCDITDEDIEEAKKSITKDIEL